MIKDTLKTLRDRYVLDRTDAARNVGCTEFEVNNWSVSKFIVHKLVPIVGLHPYPIAELNLMVSAVCRLRPEQIFEWGTNIGKSARIFYETGKHFGIPIDIHSIDLPDEENHEEHPKSTRGRLVRRCSNVTLHQGDGLGTSIELYQRSPQCRTLVFIDGDHSYDSVRRELTGVIAAMDNAQILLHDTFYQSDESGYNCGPFRAVQELLSRKPGEYQSLSTNTGLPGMTLLYRFK